MSLAANSVRVGHHIGAFTNSRPMRLSTVRCAAAAPQAAVAPAPTAAKVSKPTLFDMPVSNCGARVRHVIYAKGLEDTFDIVMPSTLGGLKSEAYLALNPQGKMPMLLLPDGRALPESEVIAQYIVDKWAGAGPSLRAATPEARATAALATRINDIYIMPLIGCMYKKMEAPQREQQLKQLAFQLDVLEGIVSGPYVAGEELTTADSAIMPNLVFITYMLPMHFGWPDVFGKRPKLAALWQKYQDDPVAAKVIAEMRGALEGWSTKGRWQELGIADQVANKDYEWGPF